MGKRNFTIPIEVHNAKMRKAKFAATQIMWDAFSLAMNDMGFGEKRLTQAADLTAKYHREILELLRDDYKADKEMVFAKESIDKRLKSIYKDSFQPWEERYED